jgi:hypothetical protein
MKLRTWKRREDGNWEMEKVRHDYCIHQQLNLSRMMELAYGPVSIWTRVIDVMGFILMAPKKRLEVSSIFGVLISIRGVMRKCFVSWRQEKGNV